jgi:hypothetical protein
MIQTLLVSLVAFTTLYATLLRQRMRVERSRDRFTRLRAMLERRETV